MVQLFANTTFLVECFWPDLDPQQVRRTDERLAECAAQAEGEGSPVAYLGSIEVTDDDVVFFLFEAASSEVVRRVCELAQVQFERVVGSVVSASPRH